jgi:D-arabinose 1-dehydrogenase-like Zn-dependent alcohol dehydrogenase
MVHLKMILTITTTKNLSRGPTEYPCVTGHEIVGTCTRAGANVKYIKVGQRVGVGAQSGACLDCKDCNNGEENLCQKGCVMTYNSKYPK